MNTKTLIIIFIVAIVVVGGGSIILLTAKNPQKQSGIINQVSKEDKNPNNLNYLAKQGKVLPVILSEAGAVPSSIKLNKGEAINFNNSTNKNLELKVSGQLNTLVKIPAGKSQISPIFRENGISKFEDAKNPKISGEIVVGSSSQPSVSVPERKSVSIVIDSSGFSPNKITITKDTLISFENKSGKDFYLLKTNEMPPMPNVLLSSTEAKIEFKEGKYQLVNKNNVAQTLEIVVNK